VGCWGSCFPTLSPEKRRKDGARWICGWMRVGEVRSCYPRSENPILTPATKTCRRGPRDLGHPAVVQNQASRALENRERFETGVGLAAETTTPYIGGAERDRTADLLVANEALSQLSYSPTIFFYLTSAQQILEMRRAFPGRRIPQLRAPSFLLRVREAFYSSRSRISGSTDSARRAGIEAAIRPSASMVMVTPARTKGSWGEAW